MFFNSYHYNFYNQQPVAVYLMDRVLDQLDLSAALDKVVTIPETVLASNFESPDTECFKVLQALVAERKLGHIAALIDLVFELQASEQCAQGTAHLLLEAAVDYLPLACIDDLWRIVSSRKARIINNLQALRPPGTTLLRTLNSLEKRLSPVLHYEMINNIGNFLFDAFGFPTRALINQKSVPVKLPIIDYRNVSDPEYTTFWRLIEDFQDIKSIMATPRSINAHLDRSNKVSRAMADNSPHPCTLAPRTLLWDTDPEVFPDIMFDSKIQRLVALQMLVVIEAILPFGPESEKPLVNEDQFNSFKALKNRWFKVLLKISSQTEMEAYKNFMLGDKEWSKWKVIGCKPLPARTPIELPQKRTLELGALSGQNRMLSESLQALWDVQYDEESMSKYPKAAEDGPESAEIRSKYGIPSKALLPKGTEKYFEYWESEYETELKSGWRWLALRLMLNNVPEKVLEEAARKTGVDYFDEEHIKSIEAEISRPAEPAGHTPAESKKRRFEGDDEGDDDDPVKSAKLEPETRESTAGFDTPNIQSEEEEMAELKDSS